MLARYFLNASRPVRPLAVALAVVLVALITPLPYRAAAASPAFPSGFAGTRIVAISDGDFVAQTYATGRLAPQDKGYRDLLTVVSMVEGEVRVGQLTVSNSVTAAPEVLALSPDGRTAFVVERLGERPEGAQTVGDLPAGHRLFAIDLDEPDHPRMAATAEIAAFPEAVAIHPQGEWLAVVSNTPEASVLQLVRYGERGFGDVFAFDLARLGVHGTTAGPRGGLTATNVQWHPSGRFLAVNLDTLNQVAFFAVSETAGRPALHPWGPIVEVGRDPFVGRFTPDGRYYLTSDWGRDFSARDLAGRVPDKPSFLSVIRLADPDAAGPANHVRTDSVATDVAAEGLAVHPNGTLVATVNMRGTAFPPDSDRFQRHASVTLLRLDPSTGRLTKLADYPLDGVLPEGATFDTAGRHLLVTVFQGHADAQPQAGAGLAVFRVKDADRPALVPAGRIAMPHGVHHVAVAGQH
ncbi:lactonase family protein [Paracidovorax citrulli]